MSIKEERRKLQLGMPYGTACNKLRKEIMFSLVCELNRNICFVCNETIESSKEFTIEHKQPWFDNDPDLFWDLKNIAFSHSKCNQPPPSRKGPKRSDKHGIGTRYELHGCRCDECKEWKRQKNLRYRNRRRR